MDRNQDETRMTPEVYYREMMNLNQVEGLSNLGILAMQQQEQVLPAQNPLNGDFAVTMASMTSSMISPYINTAQRPLTYVLQPTITQQQLDPYNNLNTEDIAKKVRKQLKQYSISQQLFGELLGISQTYVSNLLLRPKPWHRLTQKGRDLYIRMKMFLEDETALQKLLVIKHKNKKKRIRQPRPLKAISEQQNEALRLAFVMARNPDVTTIEFLAQELNLSNDTITKWFYSQRSRLKQEAHDDPTGRSPPFDHMQFRLLLNQRMSQGISRGIEHTGEELVAGPDEEEGMEQMTGLDLSMGALKRNSGDFDATTNSNRTQLIMNFTECFCNQHVSSKSSNLL